MKISILVPSLASNGIARAWFLARAFSSVTTRWRRSGCFARTSRYFPAKLRRRLQRIIERYSWDVMDRILHDAIESVAARMQRRTTAADL